MSPIDWKNILNGSVIYLLSRVDQLPLVCSSFVLCFFVYPFDWKGQVQQKMKMTPLPMQFLS